MRLLDEFHTMPAGVYRIYPLWGRIFPMVVSAVCRAFERFELLRLDPTTRYYAGRPEAYDYTTVDNLIMISIIPILMMMSHT